MKPWLIFLYLGRKRRAERMFFDHAAIRIPENLSDAGSIKAWFRKIPGNQSKLEEWRNSHIDEPCVVLGNGPSLKNTPLDQFQGLLSCGSNGLYTIFDKIGFHTDFMFFEDRVQTYLRRKDITKLKGPRKMVALSMAYCLPKSANCLFFNERFPCSKIRPFMPRFSREFSSVVYLGGTVTFVMLQWAYFLGCNPVYIAGVDHNYGELPKRLPPGKVKIDEEIMEIIKEIHMRPDYYKIGDELGVPDVAFQDASYALANKAFQEDGREVINVGLNSSLSAFRKAPMASLR